jgi:hypothetical protein
VTKTSVSRFLASTSNVISRIRNINSEEQAALRTVQFRLMTILPEEYQERYEEIEPVSMGSAALKYGEDGKVAWGDIWDTFCDLAMAGGPPHKGKLLEPSRKSPSIPSGSGRWWTRSRAAFGWRAISR